MILDYCFSVTSLFTTEFFACAQSVESYKNVCLLKSVISDSDFRFGYNSKDCYKKKSTFEAVLSKRKCSFVYCFLGKYIKVSV